MAKSWKITERGTFELEGVRRVQIRMPAGEVNVIGSKENSRLDVSEIGRLTLDAELDSEGTLTLKTEKWGKGFWSTWGWNTRARIKLSVVVPKECSVDVATAAANVLVTGVKGGTKVRNASGEITLSGLEGVVDVRNVSGAIDAASVAGEVSMDVVSGQITLADVSGGAVRARTVSGGVVADVGEHGARHMLLRTTSGSITVRVPDNSNTRLRLHAVSGGVVADLPNVPAGWSHNRRSLEGTLGLGTDFLQAEAVSGSITLLRRPTESMDVQS